MVSPRSPKRIGSILVASAVVGFVSGCGSMSTIGGASTAGSAPATAVTATPAASEAVAPPSTAAASAMASTSVSTGPAVLGDILFTIKPRGEGGTDQIWATTADGARPLRQVGPHGWWADLSPDGKTIAYTYFAGTDHFDIWTMNADGSGVTRLTGNDFNGFRPVWSPDGTQVLFTGFGEGLLVVNKDGSGQVKVADGQMGAWSPDGKQIVYIGGPDGDDEIYVMNADGSKQIDLTNSPGNDDLPSWSADGKHITFSSDRSGNGDIYVMGADGSRVTRLTTDTEAEGWPSWSPDSRFIAFNRGPTADGLKDVWVMNADGSDQRDLTNDPTDNEADPSWR
jgi:Tol biopolymer transport system component